MNVQGDLRTWNTHDLKELLADLRDSKHLTEHPPHGRDRQANRRLKTVGEFNPEKAIRLELTANIVEIRAAAVRALQDAQQRVKPTTKPASIPSALPDPFGPDESLLIATNEIRPLWEHGFALMRERAAAHLHEQPAGNIFQLFIQIYDQLLWELWPPSETQITTDKTSRPILCMFNTVKKGMSHWRFGASSVLASTGLMMHGIQQYKITPEWAGVGMLKAFSYFLSQNTHLEKLRALIGKSNYDTALSNRVDSDAVVPFVHTVSLCTNNQYFPLLQNILNDEHITSQDALNTFLQDTPRFIKAMRRLDLLFVDAKPLSRHETCDRIFTCAEGLKFLLHANLVHGGNRTTDYGIYDKSWSGGWNNSQDMVDGYARLFDPQPAQTPNTPEPVEEKNDTPADTAAIAWSRARHSIQSLSAKLGENIPQLPVMLMHARNDLAQGEGAGLHILEMTSCLHRWAERIAQTEFPQAYLRLCEGKASDKDVILIRASVQDLVQFFLLHAFFNRRVDALSVEQTEELLLATSVALNRVELQHFPAPQEMMSSFASAVLYTLLREVDSKNVSAAETKFTMRRREALAQQNSLTGAAEHMLDNASMGLFERQAVAHVASILPHSDNIPRAHQQALASLRKQRLPFLYALDHQGDANSPKTIVMSADPAEHNHRFAVALRGSIGGSMEFPRFPNTYTAHDAMIGAIMDPTLSVYAENASLQAAHSVAQIAIPPLWDDNGRKDSEKIRSALPIMLRKKQRDIRIICPHIPAETISKTLFVECDRKLYALCPSEEVAKNYGQPCEASVTKRIADHAGVYPGYASTVAVVLPTIAELEKNHCTPQHFEGRFFDATEPKPTHPTPTAGEGGSPEMPHLTGQRLKDVRDTLLRLRLDATYSWDGKKKDEAETAPDFSKVEPGHWVIIDLPHKNRQIFVSDAPERTYVYPGMMPIAECLKKNAITPQRLQSKGARQIFWNSEEQFESSLEQALSAEKIEIADQGSVDALLAHHKDHVRGRIEALVAHINNQPGRITPIVPQELTLGALRGNVHSGKAPKEAYCGETIAKDLARMAGYEDPIVYPVLKEFFDLLIKKLYTEEVKT